MVEEVCMSLDAEEEEALLKDLQAIAEDLKKQAPRINAEIREELRRDNEDHMRVLAQSRAIIRGVW
jgi:hypothetical protein